MRKIILNGQEDWKRLVVQSYMVWTAIKVHSKLCLITKKTNGKIEYYTQIGTGNYNEKTARLYTDLSLGRMIRRLVRRQQQFSRHYLWEKRFRSAKNFW